jgi:uncharacterized protein (TIGR00251 family)
VGALLTVRVQTGAQNTEILGTLADGSLKVRLKAAPVKGEANRELVSLVARRYGVPESAVRIVRGRTSRMKVVSIDGIDHVTNSTPTKGV